LGVSSSSTGEQLNIYNGLNYYAGTVPGGDHLNDNESAPKVFATVLLFDKKLQPGGCWLRSGRGIAYPVTYLANTSIFTVSPGITLKDFAKL
jgi:hypothetical protein